LKLDGPGLIWPRPEERRETNYIVKEIWQKARGGKNSFAMRNARETIVDPTLLPDIPGKPFLDPRIGSSLAL